MGKRLLLTGLVIALGAAAPAQDEPPAEQEKRKKIEVDLSKGAPSLTEDLEKSLQWKDLFHLFGVSEFHLFPAREVGPFQGPPLRIWGNGWGTSLWRDPVTGWPLQ